MFGVPNVERREATHQVRRECASNAINCASASLRGITTSPQAVYSRSVNTTERYDTGWTSIASMPCSAVASNSSESPGLTSTTLPP